MKNLVKIMLIIAIGVIFGACNKTNDGNPYYKISDVFKQYCLFQEQSEWTYQDDSTNISYNLTVSDISSYIGFHSPDNLSGAYSFDAIDIVFDTATKLDLFRGTLNAGNPTTGSGDMTDMYWLFFKNGNYLLAFAPGYPLGEEQRLGDNPGYYTNIEILNDFNLNGKDYTDVYHTQVKKTEGTPDTVYYQFYFAPNYGLIKWTRRVSGQTTSYSLTQSNLIQ